VVFQTDKSAAQKVDGIRIADFERPDEWCGFGSTFAVTEEAVTAASSCDRGRCVDGDELVGGLG